MHVQPLVFPVDERPAMYAGLELLATATLLLSSGMRVLYANPAAENLFELSRRQLEGNPVRQIFGDAPALFEAIDKARGSGASYTEQELELAALGKPRLHLSCTVSVLDSVDAALLLEFRHIDQQLKIAREERLLEQQQANRDLIRGLAHEIKNPLGGIRGAAQLLEMEVDSRDLKEYTQVIIHEADRLQTLVDRLLAPHRRPHLVGDVNIHEVCERVRALISAEFPRELTVVRDYDTSIPEFRGDREQLIQTVLNVAHNACQALTERMAAGDAVLTFRTRVARQSTFGKQRYRLALELHVIDNGPGVPEAIKDRIFYPLVSGREGGSGLGLTLAQTFVQQHHGLIECDSVPGHTDFTILIPLP